LPASSIYDLRAVIDALWAFLTFSLAASAVYIANDIKDINYDREHPAKKSRPLASGALSIPTAMAFMAMLLASSFSVALAFLPRDFIYVLIAYLLLNTGYCLHLKHVALVDVVCVAIGFVLRVFAGGIASDVPVSHWLVIMTFLLAIFLALGKRRDDLLLSADGCALRKCLSGYNLEFVSSSMVIMASVVMVAYLLYCVSPEVIQKHDARDLYLTAFWVVLGLLRYLQLTFVHGRSESPTLILIHDHFLLATIVGWIVTCYWIIYVVGH
jgi:4-hydroxybenzoate polyprenyltransferase